LNLYVKNTRDLSHGKCALISEGDLLFYSYNITLLFFFNRKKEEIYDCSSFFYHERKQPEKRKQNRTPQGKRKDQTGFTITLSWKG
jgi:hypothetical protein